MLANALSSQNSDGPCKTFSHNRLHILEARFKLHELLNSEWEHKQQKVRSTRSLARSVFIISDSPLRFPP